MDTEGSPKKLPPDERRCKGKGKDGERCRAYAVRGADLCRGHSLSTEERERMTALSVQARSERAEARQDVLTQARKGLKVLMAEALEERAADVVERLLRIVETGTDADALRAAEVLMSRVHGRPVQPTEDLTPRAMPSTLEEVAAMSPEERRALIQQVAQP